MRRELRERLAVTPVVVLDPEDRAQVERLAAAYLEAWSRHVPDPGSLVAFTTAMQAALRSFIEPPKPDEPTGLGAVVEDAHGQRWVRADNREPAVALNWFGGGRWWSYQDIEAVKTLDEGVR